MLKLLIFDLDDTLFEEKQYVLSGYRAVADFLARKTNLSADELYNSLRQGFETKGRAGAMDRLIEKFSIEQVPASALVHVYRRHTPRIDLHSEALVALKSLKSQYQMALLTNGWVQVQKRKVSALQIDRIFDLIVYAQERGLHYRKPHTRFFRRVLRHFKVDPKDALMIGDDLVADGEGALAVGMEFFRIERPGDLKRLVAHLGHT